MDCRTKRRPKETKLNREACIFTDTSLSYFLKMFLFSRFFRFDVYTYAGHRKKTGFFILLQQPIIFIKLQLREI